MLHSVTMFNEAHLGVVICRQNLIDPLLPQQIILKLSRILAASRGWRRVHPFQLLCSFLPRLFLLQSLQFLQLPLLFLFFTKLVEFLLLLKLTDRDISVNGLYVGG